MTTVEVEEVLEQIAQYEAIIKAAEDKRDALIQHYQSKIAAAELICTDETAQIKAEIALLMEQLQRHAAENLQDGRRSIKYPSGTLAFRKQAPRFYTEDMREVDGHNEKLLTIAKAIAPQFVKTTEYVDWAKFKTKLGIAGENDENVFFTETGEMIDGLRAQVLPDKFTVKTA